MKRFTADEIWTVYQYWSYKAMLQEGSYPKGKVKEWRRKFKEFSKKEFICTEDINKLPSKKFANERINSPKHM